MNVNIDKVRQYISSKHNGLQQFSDHDDLIDNRLIDSLQFVEFILYIEELTGATVILPILVVSNSRILKLPWSQP